MEKKGRTSEAPDELFSQELDWKALGEATEGMSGADIENIINLTVEEKTIAELEGGGWAPITTEDILATVKKYGRQTDKKRKREELASKPNTV